MVVYSTNKLALVEAIREAKHSREEIAEHFGIPVSEVESWERAYDVARKRGWNRIPGQMVTQPA